MNGFHTDIEKATVENTFFRQVLFTAKYIQLVVMSLKPGEEIGLEVHNDVDQFFRFEKGNGLVLIDGNETVVKEDDVVIVPAGSQHNILNSSKSEDLKLYTIYTPPNHPDGTIHKTKTEADLAEKEKHS